MEIFFIISLAALSFYYSDAQDYNIASLQKVIPTAVVKNSTQPLNSKQPAGETPFTSPYKTGLLKGGLVITSAVAVTLVGYELIKNKKDLTPAQLVKKHSRFLRRVMINPHLPGGVQVLFLQGKIAN